ncbi:MAG: hypothetical protein J5658_03950 [Prevotella sp.]|nr:hypothetical protein [Prevotella sp.]
MTRKEVTSLQKAIARLNADLAAFAKETEDFQAVLYEDANSRFSVAEIELSYSGRVLSYLYDYLDGHGFVTERERIIDADEVREYIKYWKSCLRRAKRYWSMDTETLDAIQDGERDDIDDED